MFSRFSDLTGVDYSEGSIKLARRLADRDGFSNINLLVCPNFNAFCHGWRHWEVLLWFELLICVCVCERERERGGEVIFFEKGRR